MIAEGCGSHGKISPDPCLLKWRKLNNIYVQLYRYKICDVKLISVEVEANEMYYMHSGKAVRSDILHWNHSRGKI